jgi:hypothetical protein
LISAVYEGFSGQGAQSSPEGGGRGDAAGLRLPRTGWEWLILKGVHPGMVSAPGFLVGAIA